MPREAKPLWEPSPQKIAAEAARIRAGWDEAEHRKRAAWAFSNDVLPMTTGARLSKRQTAFLERRERPA